VGTLAFVEAAARALDEERAAKIQAAISTPMTPKVRGEGRRQ